MPEPLDIKVGVTGAAQAAQQLDNVTAAAQRADDATDKISTTQAQRDAAQAALKGIEADEKAAAAKKKLADAANDAGKKVGQFKDAAAGAGNVVGGLAQASEGGINGLLGLGRAAEGVRNVLKGLGSTALLAPLLAAFGAVSAAVLALNGRARANRREMELLFKAQEERATALKKVLAELETQSVKSLEAQVAAVKRLTTAYDELLGRMDDATARQKQITEATVSREKALLDRDEQAALAKARTPEERAKITASFAEQRDTLGARVAFAAIETDELNARNRARAAQDAVGARSGALSGAEVDAAAKAQARADAEAAVKAIPKDEFNSANAQATRDALKAAVEAERLSQANLSALRDEVAKLSATAENEAAAAQQTAEVAKLRRDELTLSTQAAGLRRANAVSATGVVDVGSIEGRRSSLAGERASLEDQLFRSSGLSSDPRNAGIVRAIEEIGRQQQAADNELTSALQRNAAAQAAAKKEQARELQKTTDRLNDSRP